jgi:hypothetical protein
MASVRVVRRVTYGQWRYVAMASHVPEEATSGLTGLSEAVGGCGICQSAFEVLCPQCTSMPSDDDKDGRSMEPPMERCPPVEGNCRHVFHGHCLRQWLRRQRVLSDDPPQCPMCRQPWSMSE